MSGQPLESAPEVAGPAANNAGGRRPGPASWETRWLRVLSTLVILGVAVYVALWPNVFYAPTPRVILYFLIALMSGILLGSEAAAQFELRTPALILTAAGTAAVVFGAFWMLVHFTKADVQIAVYQIFDEQGNKVNLEWDGAIEILTERSGLSPTRFVNGHALVLIFPEQLPEVTLQVRKSSRGPVYEGPVGYAGAQSSQLRLGTDLVINRPQE